jgi:hypothetical protein
MFFPIRVHTSLKTYKLKGEVIYQSEQLQRVRVTGKNGSIILQNNRPFLLSKGLKSKRVHWSLKEGQINNVYFVSRLIEELDRYFKRDR